MINKGSIYTTISILGISFFTLMSQRPEARQLLFSLKEYMTGNRFNPPIAVEAASLRTLLISNK